MTISLCIIARDEAAFLGRCIESAKTAVDEVVVVDTGSADETPQIAERCGARVFHSPWPGDFAQAYNLPLEHARGEWILSLDADEALDPETGPVIRDLAAEEGREGYLFTVRNYAYCLMTKWRTVDSLDPLAMGAMGWRPSCSVRLFRNHAEHRYFGEVHQSVYPSIVRRGGRVAEPDVPIHHYGLLRFDRISSKSSRYLKLAQKKVASQPESGRAWIELGVLLADAKDCDGALNAFRKARSLGYEPGSAFYLGHTLLEIDQPAAAAEHLREALRENPDDRDIDFDLADAWEVLGRAQEALGQTMEAERCQRRALRSRPDSPVAANNLAGLLSQRGAFDEADELLQNLLARYPGLDMPWATLGTNRLRGEDFAGARAAFETALSIDPRNLPARINLALTLEISGESEESRKAYALAEETRGSASDPEERPAPCTPSSATEFGRLRAKAAAQGAVVSLISHLAGGGGRVLADVAGVLRDRPQLVLCEDPGSYDGLGLRAEIEDVGIEVRAVSDAQELRHTLEEIRPAAVLHHWWASPLFRGPVRVGDERWVAIGHTPQPMPDGYDVYVVLSDFHALCQGHLRPERIRRIPNGVDRSRFRPQARPRPAEAPVTIAMLSRLDPGKFPRRLFSYLPALEQMGARLVVAGRGPRRFEIEPELEDAGLADVVQFIGPVPSHQVPAFLMDADVGLHLTETHLEICTLTILEMLAAGLPVVAQPAGCIPEMIVDGQNGFLSHDEQEIADRLRELVLTPGLRKQMGQASRRCSERYDLGQFRSSYRALVAELTR